MCKPEKHPLYACPRFRDMTHDIKVCMLKSNRFCMNCLGPNHFVKQCKSHHKCKQCQKPHYTLLHVENIHTESSTPTTVTPQSYIISSHTAIGLKWNSLLMTCRVLVKAPDGTSVEAGVLLDNGSSASFTFECLAQSLCLPRANQSARISGITGLSHNSPLQSFATFSISPVKPSAKKVNITAVMLPQITYDLLFNRILFKAEWNHLSDLRLADPGEFLVWMFSLTYYITDGRQDLHDPLSPLRRISDGYWLETPLLVPCAPHQSYCNLSCLLCCRQ